jgi:hypothetical protein
MGDQRRRHGTAFEFYVRNYFRDLGYYAVIQRLSAFPDLTVITPGGKKIMLIECKVVKKFFSEQERERMKALCKRYHATGYLAYSDWGKIKLERIT